MYKLRFYKLTGADRGAFEHETEYKSIRAMLTAYHEAVQDERMKFGYDPTPWVYSEESGEYVRLWWNEYLDEEGCSLNDLYREVKAFEEAVDAAVLEDVTAEIEGKKEPSIEEYHAWWNNPCSGKIKDCDYCPYNDGNHDSANYPCGQQVCWAETKLNEVEEEIRDRLKEEDEEIYSEVEHEYNALLTAYGDCERCVYGMQGECHLQCNN